MIQWAVEAGLPVSAELAALRSFQGQRPDDAAIVLRLARRLAFFNQYAEATEVCEQGLARFPALHALRGVLGECANAMGRHEAARQWLAGIPDGLAPGTRSHGLYEAGAAEEALGEREAALAFYRAALEVQPTSPHPCRAMHKLMRERGEVDGVLQHCEAMLEQGVRHPRVRADWMVASALLGRRDEALRALSFERFARFGRLEDPDIDGGRWADMAAFNARLQAELSEHPDLQYGRRNTASRDAWRVQSPFSGYRRPALTHLADCVRREVSAYVAGLDRDPGHFFPHPEATPYGTSSWAVRVRSQGHEDWHVHPGGWITVVYYVKVPDLAPDEDPRAGAITFGLPDFPGMPETGGDWVTFRPEAGLLGMFPSHCFHRTWPTRREDDRWVVVFDVAPTAG